MRRERELPHFDDDAAAMDAATRRNAVSAAVAAGAPTVPGGATDVHEAPTRVVAVATGAAVAPVGPAAIPPMAAPPAPLPLPSPAGPAAPAATPPVACRSAAASASPPLPPLPFPPSKDLGEKPRRRLPRKWRVALAVAGALVALAILGGHGGRRQRRGARIQVAQEDLVVNEADLRKRKEVSPADFRTRDLRGRVVPVAPASPPPPPAAPTPADGDDLEARRARRSQDPEELAPAPGPRPAPATPMPAVRAAPPAAADRPLYLAPSGTVPAGAPGAAGAGAAGAVVVRAGTVLPAALTAPLVLAGGSCSVVVRVDDDAPQLPGARFVGTATASQGRVTLRFRTLLLASGEEYDVRAEARDQDGAFGLAVGGSDPDDERSVEAEVAADTGTDVVSDALGGIGGAVVRSYTRKKRHTAPRARARAVRLEDGTTLEIFVHDTLRTTTK